ncbi:MAG: DNA mismatch repair protein MutS [Polyangia bacterium]
MIDAAAGPAELYTRRRAEALAAQARLEGLARRIGLLRLLAFLLSLAAATAAYDRFLPGVPAWSLWTAAVLLLGAFIALVLRHDAVLQERARAIALAEVNRRGLRRLEIDGTWTAEPMPPPRGELATMGVEVPGYARDLDLGFEVGTGPEDQILAADKAAAGRGSLLHLCDTTTTRFGAGALRRLLSKAAQPDGALETMRRQAAVRELVPQVALRQALEVSGRLLVDDHGRRPDPEPFLRWAEGAPLLSAKLRLLLLLPLVTLPLLVLQQLVPHPLVGSALFVLLAAHALVFALTGGRINKLVNVLGARDHVVYAYAEMLRLCATADLKESDNYARRERLRQGGRPAHEEIAALCDLSSALNLRRHPLLWLPVNFLTMWDLFFALRVVTWQARCGAQARDWLAALGEMEACSALATLGFDNPDWAWPEIVEGPAELTAEALGHPLLARARRVGNDVTLPGPGRAWLLTGSNMSGKSTLLRSLGLATVLALAGGPVCARRARLCPMRLSTVVRVDDSVLDGVSRFYAELLRLRETLTLSQQGPDSGAPPLFFLLDEILHGTNTRERELGAKLVVKTLCRRGAMGAVSTHDLGLAALAEETAGAVENVHFTETLQGDRMAFDYQLRPGPVRTTNALRLMRRIGLALDWSLEPAERDLVAEPGDPAAPGDGPTGA